MTRITPGQPWTTGAVDDETAELAAENLAAVPELQDASNTTYYSDGLHFSAAGAALAATPIAAALEAA